MVVAVGKKENSYVKQKKKKNQIFDFFEERNFNANFIEDNQIELETFSKAGEKLIDFEIDEIVPCLKEVSSGEVYKYRMVYKLERFLLK